MHSALFLFLFSFLSSGRWVKTKLKAPTFFHVSDTCRVSVFCCMHGRGVHTSTVIFSASPPPHLFIFWLRVVFARDSWPVAPDAIAAKTKKRTRRTTSRRSWFNQHNTSSMCDLCCLPGTVTAAWWLVLMLRPLRTWYITVNTTVVLILWCPRCNQYLPSSGMPSFRKHLHMICTSKCLVYIYDRYTLFRPKPSSDFYFLYIYDRPISFVRIKHRTRANDNLCKCLMYHAACKVEFQPFTRSYSQLTFFNFL